VLAAAGSASLATAGGKLLWLVLLGGLVMLAVGVFYAAVYAYLGRRRLTVLLLLRFLAIVSLLLVLFKPALSVAPERSGAHLVLPVLLDRSGSMETLDRRDLPSRYRRAVTALSAQRERLRAHFRPSYYHFASAPQAVADVGELAALDPSGPGTDTTDIAKAVRRAVAGYVAADLAGVVLISDGLHNAESDVRAAAVESPAPIAAVGVGSDREAAVGRRNVRLLSVSAPLEAVRHNVAEVSARVRLTGWANIPAKVVLTESGREVDSRQLLPETAAAEMPVTLKWTPGDPAATRTGADVRALKVAVEPNPAEAAADDNAAELHVLVTSPSVRVLYVEGTMRSEYKFLQRVLKTDPNLKFMSLIRMSRNRFLCQGGIAGRKLAGLPRTEEDFALFDVLILGDLDRTFWSTRQMERIRQFVHQGKALLMIGGRNSFGPGGYEGTPVEAALPVRVGGRTRQPETTHFVPRLTAAGMASPVFEGLEAFFHTPSGKASRPLPELKGCVTVPGARPGANVLAIHPTRRNRAGPLIVLAVHQYGKGRAAAFTADTTWQWHLKMKPTGGEGPYDRFWGQLVRYLAGVEKKKLQEHASVVARLDGGYVRQGQAMRVAALAKDAEGRPATEATVTAELAPAGGGKPVKVTLERTGDGGLYEATHRPAGSGRFRVTVRAVDAAGGELGADALPLVVAPRSREMDRLARDTETLKAVGRGRYWELAALPEVVDELIRRKRAVLPPAPPVRRVGLYHFALLFLIFVGLLTAEWLLRRSWQLQ